MLNFEDKSRREVKAGPVVVPAVYLRIAATVAVVLLIALTIKALG